ncbi:M20/M25/M40 family metallo-hydrolase [Streptomyces cavernicola]|uniref:M20/M25/M40 family metallo-hydrolase n=1 Tax=Streptomyces cavernicola TaxID=3043613 RepID=A0ABT6SCM5_9ACTN|nr:M20/M25/M40 family metallo-hydrolase [Streptomyces sp. B-S-A6]MDI3405719.1 M20/M25/M40 family metallo-hydrolase [Streptomyces sp. B-S-A6]
MSEQTVADTAVSAPYPQARLTAADQQLLLRLLATPTAGPLETGGDTEPVRLWEAGRQLADAAREFGMTVVRYAPPPAEVLDRDDVPVSVREAAAATPGFLDCQPSLLLRLGPAGLPHRDTVMFNVHLDTVGGWWPPDFDGTRFSGRGAIDAKGPAVALLAGIRAARAADAALGTRVGVLVQAVAGEEGGAMGTFGTRPLVAEGHTGRLNVYCEPTGHRFLPRATASMTACVQVHGDDAIDDRPEAGHNATVLLGHLAHHLATTLPARAHGAQVCVAGLHTGHQHNKVYGSGRLLLNIAYPDPSCGRAAEAALHESLREGLAAFRAGAQSHPALARTAEDAAEVTSVRWLKHGLPALNGPAGDGSWAEELLERDCGLTRWPAHEPAFTCDALWMSGVPDTYTAVFGPGSLDANRAHAEGEYADLAELDRYATEVARILLAFARRTDPPTPPPHPSPRRRTPVKGPAL